ncbi:MAG: PSD1 and planctomycete cytochrome C domain-containing protein [Planctomycetia bacterium]
MIPASSTPVAAYPQTGPEKGIVESTCKPVFKTGAGAAHNACRFQSALLKRTDRLLQTLCLAVCAILAELSAVHAAVPVEMDDEQLAFFESRIRPVLVTHCYECHSADSTVIQGGLRIDSRDGLLQGGDTGTSVVPGKPEASLLLKALQYDGIQMPPKGRLPESVVRDFDTWIAMGAADPRESTATRPERRLNADEGRRHWAFQPVAPQQPPPVKDETWPLDPLDRFLLAKLEAAGIQPVADADRYTWLRRVSLDLTGLPPSPGDIESFISDNSPYACETVVDRLLGSRAFGERWARHWLDLTGYADMMGTSNNVFAEHAWRYRDYLIDVFHKDKPFDRFVLEQIAGDLLPASSTEERAENIIATGFLMLGDVEIVEPDKPKLEADHIDTQVSKLGTVFMGMTLGCARCHDHKFDPIQLSDYYGIAGIFRSSPSTHKIPFGVWSKLNTTELPETPEQLAGRRQREAEHAEKLAAMRSEQTAMTEERKTLEATLAESEQPKPEPTLAASSAASSPAVDRAALVRQRDELDGKLKKLAQTIQHAEFFSSMVPRAFAMHDADTPADMPIFIRGNPYAPGSIVPRGALQVASWAAFPEIPPNQSGRLQLAEWLIDRQHPLTARVAVNRIWQKLFGTGLVPSVDYFGIRGEVPTHPELLDHLATRFVQGGWSQRQLIRLLVLSRAYRLSSANDSIALKIDPDNRLRWRMNRQRLDAEAIRDGLLAVSGELLPSSGGPALVLENVENTGDLVQAGVNPPNYSHRKPRPSQEFVRTIYLPVMRTGFTGQDRIRNFFDFVNPAQISGQRNESVVSTQSLFLLNNPLVRQRAEKLAELLTASVPESHLRLEQLWLRVCNRPVTPTERIDAEAFLTQLNSLLADRTDASALAWTELCHSVLSSNESIFRF